MDKAVRLSWKPSTMVWIWLERFCGAARVAPAGSGMLAAVSRRKASSFAGSSRMNCTASRRPAWPSISWAQPMSIRTTRWPEFAAAVPSMAELGTMCWMVTSWRRPPASMATDWFSDQPKSSATPWETTHCPGFARKDSVSNPLQASGLKEAV